MTPRRPFGLSSTFRGRKKRRTGDIFVFENGGTSWISDDEVKSNREFIGKWKVFIPFLGSGSDSFPHPILGKPFVGEPNTISTETYLAIGGFRSKEECENVISYISTRFFRFLVLLKKPSQNATRKVYELVPLQNFSEPWTDEKLYAKYGITEAEQAFIESMIRPMDLSGGDDE